MENRLEEFLRQARTARERAEAAEGEVKTQWLSVAEMWELLAKEYRNIRRPGTNGKG